MVGCLCLSFLSLLFLLSLFFSQILAQKIMTVLPIVVPCDQGEFDYYNHLIVSGEFKKIYVMFVGNNNNNVVEIMKVIENLCLLMRVCVGSSIGEISITGCAVTVNMLPIVGEMLVANQLTSLDFVGNNMSDEMMIWLANMLPSCSSLNALNLVDQDALTYIGACAVCETMMKTQIKRFMFAANRYVGDEFGWALMSAMSQLRLVSLCVFHNFKSLDVLCNLIRSIKLMPTLRVMSLGAWDRNGYGEHVYDVLDMELPNLYFLQKFDIFNHTNLASRFDKFCDEFAQRNGMRVQVLMAMMCARLQRQRFVRSAIKRFPTEMFRLVGDMI